MPSDSPPFYYLLNFESALTWVAHRYDDLLDHAERAFVAEFARLPRAARALLVRMLMRKGTRFRASRLVYEEIGCPLEAATPLVSFGWIDDDPLLTLDELFSLCTRPELVRMFASDAGRRQARKADWLQSLAGIHTEARPFRAWDATTSDRVLHVAVAPLCERLKLMFFGNLHQEWSEFVLADLGVFSYETVSFSPSARAFQKRSDVDAYLALHACHDAVEALHRPEPIDPIDALHAPDRPSQADPLDALHRAAAAIEIDQPWLETRRAKLLYRIGYRAEQWQCWKTALDVYANCAWPDARYRRMRVLERCECFDEAFALASKAADAPAGEAEAQRVARLLPRLRRRLGHAAPREARPPVIERGALVLPSPGEPALVEHVVRDYLHSAHAPVYYVENALINSIFGLLCWEAVFAPVPGAFFHPFQRGPADLHAPDFRARRIESFERCLARLDDGTYQEIVWLNFETKAGLQSPFVFWGTLTPELVSLALACLPAAHLKLWFARLLEDVRGNRSGLPDLVQFWPGERRYRLIEVKGPGDRLQDNQTRWLDYCVRHGMPVSVLDVRWAEAMATDGPSA